MKKANCLSLSGGGCRGLIQLHQLDYLHHLFGNKNDLFYKNFDYISGTSTGALITSLLSLGYQPKEIIDIYIKELPNIFDKKWFRFGINRPKYDNKYLIGLSKDLLGENRLGDCKVNIIIPAFNSDCDKTKIFKSEKKEDKNFLLREVVIASSSAPTYFAPIKIDGYNYKDGGLGYNNPSDILSKETRGRGFDIVNILSVTTGKKTGVSTKAEIKGGLFGASASFDDILKEQDNTTHSNVEYDYNHFYKGKGVYLRSESIIKNSSGKIDDASKANINRMIEDGKLSASKNKLILSYFVNQSHG